MDTLRCVEFDCSVCNLLQFAPNFSGADPGFFQGGGGDHERRRRDWFSRGGVCGMLPHKILKIRVSKVAISSILRLVSWS